MKDLTSSWLQSLSLILAHGVEISPRGKLTKEILQRTMVVDMRQPVLTLPQRKLSYKFMAAEAFWILTGDNMVETIAPYNSRIKDFSDDGETFFGAYGPKITSQLGYVLDKLVSDKDSRQAGMNIWRENPPETKDVPCTVSIFFSIRGDKLNAHVFMRSSDVWLGVPYDVFNFSMLSHLVCGFLNTRNETEIVSPGLLYLTAASSHIYETNWLDAIGIVDSSYLTDLKYLNQPKTPSHLYLSHDSLYDHLKQLRDAEKGSDLRWWES